MKRIALAILALQSFSAYTQRFIWSPDSISLADPNYSMDRYHDILRYHDPIMYIAFPVIKPIADRRVPLADGEGKNGFWLEGNFAYRFVVQQGKYYSYPFFQRMRLTFDVGLTPRMARDHSSPLLPSNNKFGLSLDYLLSGLNQLKQEKTTLVWTTLQLHHYSNGQADSFFIKNPIRRNNYISGDFSTNYYRALFNIAGTNQQKNIVSTALGYQKQIDLGGPFSSNKELQQYYGDSRLLFYFQWTQKPKLATANYQNRATADADTIKIEKRRQVTFRTELEYILGDLSNFPGSNKRRLAWHGYLTYMPSVTNDVGFMLHGFAGRDYLNIRFDDIVFIGEAGFYVKFNSK